MRYRRLGRTGFDVSTVGFGAWAIGNAWGKVDDGESTSALRRALDLGVNFFDTADVYGDGRSERLLAELRRERKDGFYVATKAGRRLSPHDAAGYTRENLTGFVERSLRNLGTDTIDLLQLHCPPTEVYYRPEVFGALDALVREGKIRFYGVSVERVEEALKAIEYPGVQSVQIIYNVLRQRPADLFFAEAKRREVGVIVRLPLSSGLLTGKMRQHTTFEATDHRAFNRHGEAFDRGETFSGVDYALGLSVVEKLRPFVPEGTPLSTWALGWILQNEAVTCTIPGAKRKEQVEENAAAAELPPIPPETMSAVRELYTTLVRPHVHQYW